METVDRLQLQMERQQEHGTGAADLATLRNSHEHLKAECADRHARQLEAERRVEELAAELAAEQKAAQMQAPQRRARGCAMSMKRCCSVSRKSSASCSWRTAKSDVSSISTAAKITDLEAQLQQHAAAHAALTGSCASRQWRGGGRSKVGEKCTRDRPCACGLFDAAKAQNDVQGPRWESAQRRLAEHAEQLLRLQQGDSGNAGNARSG